MKTFHQQKMNTFTNCFIKMRKGETLINEDGFVHLDNYMIVPYYEKITHFTVTNKNGLIKIYKNGKKYFKTTTDKEFTVVIK